MKANPKQSVGAFVIAEGGFSLIELMIVVAILAILAAIGVPQYLRIQGQARQAEAKTNLGAIFVTESAFFTEYGRFSNFTESGFRLTGTSNRYTYRSEQTDSSGTGTGVIQVIAAQVGASAAENTVVPSASSATGFTATATADLDNDISIDQWHINDVKDGSVNPDVNDVMMN
jgi:prepilin-type N-terminal cleavage/methylation domain-containing protein